MPNHKDIEDQAAAWLARRDSGAWSPADQRELDRWLDSSTSNRVAYLRLEYTWEEAARLKALGAGRAPRAVPPPGDWRHSPFFDSLAFDPVSEPAREDGAARTSTRVSGGPRFRFVVGTLAASIVVAAVTGGYFLKPWRDNHRYQTPVGGVASVPLQDGSKITLNTDTDVRVDLTPKERRVDLERGEAYFVVAKDPGRPFVVHVGNKRVTAVGTQFSVRRGGEEVRVVVTEGTVRFESARASDTSGEHADTPGSATPEIARLSAGAIARSTDGDVLVESTSVSEAEEAVSWRAGYLTFHDTTLAEAVEEFNRYNTHRITIEDPKVAGIRISGTFRPTNYGAFVRLLESGYSIRAHDAEDETALSMN